MEDAVYQYAYDNEHTEQDYRMQPQYDAIENPTYEEPHYDPTTGETTYELVQYDTNGDHITVSNPTRMETLEEMQARIAEEVRAQHTTPVQPEPQAEPVNQSDAVNVPVEPTQPVPEPQEEPESDEEAGDLVIDEPEVTQQPVLEPEPVKENSPTGKSVGKRPEPISVPVSSPPNFSVPESPVNRSSTQSTPVKPESRLPSGPHISTDSEATPTKPKHIRMSTSSEDSVFFGNVRRRSRDESTPKRAAKPLVQPEQKTEPEVRLEDSYSADSEEEMDSDFDDMPDLEDTPTDTFMEDLPTLEELPVSLPVKSRKRKSLPNAVQPPQMSPVKRHRRGIRRSKSAAESYVQLQTRIK